jgi:hypothetical protein
MIPQLQTRQRKTRSVLRRFDIALHQPSMMLGNFMLVHGDRRVEIPKRAVTDPVALMRAYLVPAFTGSQVPV